MKLWVVGKSIKDCGEGQIWECQGIFDTQAAAEARCINSFYFVGPVTLNENLPDERIDWPGSYRPKT